MIRLFLACLASLSAAETYAQLRWETQSISRVADFTEERVVALFPFKNEGSTTISILDLRPSCDCTTAELDKRTYASGESGTVTATFTIGKRMGAQEKQIAVLTEAQGKKERTMLRLHVEIPELLGYSTTVLRWNLGTQPVPRTIHVEALNGDSLTSLKISKVTPELADVKIGPSTHASGYDITITPLAIDKLETVNISILASFSNAPDRIFQIHGLVR